MSPRTNNAHKAVDPRRCTQCSNRGHHSTSCPGPTTVKTEVADPPPASTPTARVLSSLIAAKVAANAAKQYRQTLTSSSNSSAGSIPTLVSTSSSSTDVVPYAAPVFGEPLRIIDHTSQNGTFCFEVEDAQGLTEVRTHLTTPTDLFPAYVVELKADRLIDLCSHLHTSIAPLCYLVATHFTLVIKNCGAHSFEGNAFVYAAEARTLLKKTWDDFYVRPLLDLLPNVDLHGLTLTNVNNHTAGPSTHQQHHTIAIGSGGYKKRHNKRR
ncbi:hypothetical protein MNV49_003477 [Pseudohyphozyma bogoriensis]|nr:hypothetical protein MNV49_003477 [Pseudohyphozyma bogoriensis]